MKVCFLLQRRFAYIGHKLAIILKEKYGVEDFCGYVYLRSSFEFLKKQTEWVGQESVSLAESSLNRFYEAAQMTKTYDSRQSKGLIGYGFDILSRVAISDLTRWSIVYDIPNLKVHFRTDLKPNIKTIAK